MSCLLNSLKQEDWISVNADTAEGFEPVMELHASEGPVRSLTILRGQTSTGGETPDHRQRQIQVLSTVLSRLNFG